MAEDNVTTTQGTHVSGDGQQSVADAQTFTKEDMERIVRERLNRQKAQYSDYEDLKAQAAKLAEYEDAQKTELERAQAERDRAQAERDEALQRANDRLIRAAVVTEAAKLSFADPGDAFAMVDLGDVAIGDDGGVSGVAEAVKALAEAKPYLVGRARAPTTDAGAGGGQRTAADAATRLTEEEMEYARKLGVTPEQYARGKSETRVQEDSAFRQLEAMRAENRRLRAQLGQ